VADGLRTRDLNDDGIGPHPGAVVVASRPPKGSSKRAQAPPIRNFILLSQRAHKQFETVKRPFAFQCGQTCFESPKVVPFPLLKPRSHNYTNTKWIPAHGHSLAIESVRRTDPLDPTIESRG
jgi:hypothetical protein